MLFIICGLCFAGVLHFSCKENPLWSAWQVVHEEAGVILNLISADDQTVADTVLNKGW